MGDMADDLAHQEWQENSRYHSELNPRGVKTSEDFVWTMHDGKKIKLSDMGVDHIKNCIWTLKMLQRQIIDPWDVVGDHKVQETIGILHRELKLRGEI